MKQFKKLTICLATLTLLNIHFTSAQTDFEQYRQKQKADFEQYRTERKTEFADYRDSINRVYAKYLEEKWKEFDLQRQDRTFKPMPKPPVYDPSKTNPNNPPQKLLPVTPLPNEKPQPVPVEPATPIKPQPIPVVPEQALNAVFFGSKIRLKPNSLSNIRLSGITEKEVAAYWQSLSKLPYPEWMDDVRRIKQELNLNDWGMYQLVNQLFSIYNPKGSENEQIIFSVFLLNQLGYCAKIGRTNNELVALAAFTTALYDVSFFIFNQNGKNLRYFVLNPHRKKLSSIQTCSMAYDNAALSLDLSLKKTPLFDESIKDKQLNFNNIKFTIEYNQNIIDFYNTYPAKDFRVYADASIDETALESLQTALMPHIRGKSQEAAINFLLHFVQTAFDYKTDQEQFGYEKWNFAEETLASSFSDCDDRAIFFAQLVKHFMRMKVVLVEYPGYHLATAVRFDNPKTDGDYVMLDGKKYLICDPTYIHADLGMAMPQLNNIPIEIIRLK